MELNQLKYFQVLSRLEHFTHAAGELHISQPSLSKSISNLESELGVQLFDRYNRSVHLNRYGQAFLKYVDRILCEVDNAAIEIQDMRHGNRGDIRIASTYYLDQPDGPADFIRQFLFENTGVSMHIYYMESASMETLLQNRKISFALTTDSLKNPDFMSEELFSYRMGIVVNRDDPLAARKSVRLMELKDYSFLSNNSSPDLHDTIYEICGMAGFRPNVKIECDNGDLIGEAISRGLGISFITERRYRANAAIIDEKKPWRQKLVFVPVEDEYCKRSIRILYLREAYRTTCEKNFLRDIKKFFATHAES